MYVIANPTEGDIYNTQSSAGYASFAVLAGGGQDGGTVVSTTEELGNAIAAGVTDITLKAGTYDFSAITVSGFDGGVYTVTSDLNLVADGDVTVIGGFILGTGPNSINFDGITFEGNNEDCFIKSADEGTISNTTSVTVTNCDISGYAKSIIYTDKVDGITIGDVKFSGNIIHDNGNGQGGFDFRKGSVTSLTIMNNTIYNSCRDVIRADVDVLGSVSVVNNTFANVLGTSNGFFYIRSHVSKYEIANNLFINMPGYKMMHDTSFKNNSSVLSISNNFYYNLKETWFSDSMTQEIATSNGGAVLTACPVADTTAHDFTLTNTVLMAKKVGDPRWNPQADMPSASSIEINSMEELVNAIASGANDFTLNAGTYDFRTAGATGFSENGVFTASSDLTIRGNGNVTVIGGFKFGAGMNNLYISGITFNGVKELGEASVGNFLEDVADATAAQSIIVRNCIITNFNKSIIYVNQATSTIGSVEFTGNEVYGMGTGQGTFDMRKGSVGSLTVMNNTIHDGSRDILRADDGVTGMTAMTVSNNTFYNITGNNSNGFARIRATIANGITISNNIFMNMLSENYPFVHSNTIDANTVNVARNFFFNFHEEWFSDMDQATAIANGGAVLTASPLADPANGDFTVTDATVKAAGAGDGRWL